MSLDLDKLVSSQRNYELRIKQTLQIIKGSNDVEAMLKKVILFCKYALSVNGNQRKKFLCLQLIRDIFECVQSANFEKMLQANIAHKVLKVIQMQLTSNGKDSRMKEQNNEEYSEKMMIFAVETIVFWSKKNTSGKSAFKQIYEDLKKLKVNIPKFFNYYNPELLLQLTLQKPSIEKPIEKIKQPTMSKILQQISNKFHTVQTIIQAKISQTLVNEDDLNLREIQRQIKQFLLLFFLNLKQIQEDKSRDQSTIIQYYHIMNKLHSKISNKQYIPISEMILITKDTFEGSYSSALKSVNRMDVVNLAGMQKFNTLTIFERIHRRIQQQQKLLPPCEISIETQDYQKKNQFHTSQAKSRFSI